MDPIQFRAFMDAVSNETSRQWLMAAREGINARLKELAQQKLHTFRAGDRVLYVGESFQKGLVPNMSKGTVKNVRRTRIEVAWDNNHYGSLVCPPGILELLDEQHKPLMPNQPQVRIVDINERLAEAQTQLEQMEQSAPPSIERGEDLADFFA